MYNEDIIDKWNFASEEWVGSLSKNILRRNLLMPAVFHLLGDVKGKKVIDIGCGEGEYSRILAEKGATVLAVDGSEKLILAAKRMNGNLHDNPEFIVGDASNLDMIENSEFDISLSVMCLMAIAKYAESVKEMSRVLKLGGKILLVALHPCFTGPFSKIKKGGGPFHYTNDYYFKEDWFEDNLSEALKKSLPFLHRTLENFILPFLNEGLTLTHLSEPYPSNELVTEYPGLSAAQRIPMFIIMEFRK